MSLHGGGGPSGGKEKKPKSGGGFRPTKGGASPGGGGPGFTPPSRPPGGGATYTPGGGEPSGPSGAPKPTGGGFKMPGLGGGGGKGGLDTIWGSEPTQPGITSTWTEGTKMGVAVVAGLLILGAVAALVFGLAKGSKPKANNNANNGNTAVLTPFNPPTQAGATETDMPIVFTDGTTADLLYDPSLNLSSLGVELYDSGSLGSIARGADQFQIDHGGASFVANELPTSVVRNVPGPNNSPVPVLPAANNNEGKNVNGNWMDFHYGDWRVGVWEGIGSTGSDQMMSPSDEASWASSMSATVTPSGWLTLSGSGNLTLTPYGQPDGPYMVIGNLSPVGIVLTPQACSPPSGAGVQQNNAGTPYRVNNLSGGYEEGYLCLQGAKMTADIYGQGNFVSTVANSLAITNLKQGPARPNPGSGS